MSYSGGKKDIARALIQPYLIRAQADGIPVWLEASDIHARDVYTHLGFRTVETIVMGKGYINSQGLREKDGEGMTEYCMIYEPVWQISYM
jgi:hypothetical protein